MSRRKIDPGLLLDILPCEGPSSAIVGRQSAITLGCTLRDVTEAVQALRLQHVPVLSDPACGYWLYSGGPEDNAAALLCLHSLRGRIKEQAATLEALESTLATCETP